MASRVIMNAEPQYWCHAHLAARTAIKTGMTINCWQKISLKDDKRAEGMGRLHYLQRSFVETVSIKLEEAGREESIILPPSL